MHGADAEADFPRYFADTNALCERWLAV